MANSTTINTSVRTDALSAAKSTSRRSSSSDDSIDSPFEQELQTRSKQDARPGDDQSNHQSEAKRADKSAAAKTKKTKAAAKSVKPKKNDESDEDAAVAAQSVQPERKVEPVEDSPATDAADATELVKEVVAKDQTPLQQAANPEVDAATAGKVAVAQDVATKPVDDATESTEQAPAKIDPTKTKPAAQPVQKNSAIKDASHEDEVAETDEEIEHPAQAAQVQVKVNKATKPEAQPKTAPVKNTVSPLAAAPLQQKSGDATEHRQQKNDAGVTIDQQLIDGSDVSDSDVSFDVDGAIHPDKRTTPATDDLDALTTALAADPGAKQIDHTTTTLPTAQPSPSPEIRFAEDNHPQIVTGVHGQLLPNGGTMQIRLDPPELGDVQLLVHMKDGVMSAAFQTSNDEATHLLSHSLSDLRTALEASGVTVDRLHVEQAPKDQHARNDNPESRQQQGQTQDSPARRDQHRRELLQRMWKKLSDGGDPLDLVA